jgi:hypothetical protein
MILESRKKTRSQPVFTDRPGKMLENAAESPASSAPKKIAGHHFVLENIGDVLRTHI